jgi:hypothetical protein
MVQLPIRVAVRARRFTAGQTDETLREAARIWTPYGVRIDWLHGDASIEAGDSSEPLRLLLTDDVFEHASETRLGAIRFFSPSRPDNVIQASVEGARRLVDTALAARPLTGRPAALRDRLVARLLGRAVAHEIGHFVLASPRHSATGLMRPAFKGPDVVAASPARFRLEPAQARALMRWRADRSLAASPPAF